MTALAPTQPRTTGWLGSLQIRTQLIILVLAAGVPLAALVAGLTYASATNDLSKSQVAGRTTSRVIAVNVDRFVDKMTAQLMALANRDQVRLVDGAQCDPILQDLAPLQPELTNLGVIDLDGRVVCSGVPQPGDVAASVADLPWFPAALDAHELAIGEPHVGPITGKWVSTLTYPIRDDSGSLRGLIGASIDLDRFDRLVGDQSLDPGGIATIVTGDGIVVARSLDATTHVGTDVRGSEVVDDVLAGTADLESTVGVDGVERIYGSAPIVSAGWHVFAGVPTDVVLADARAMVALAVALGLIVAAVVIVLTIRVGRGIATPLRALAASAGAVADGDLGVRTAVAGPTEVAATATAFNHMIDSRQAANAARAAALAQIETLISSAPIGIAFVDRDLRYIRINEALAEINGLAVDEHLGHTIPELCGASFPVIEPYFRRVLDEGASVIDVEVTGQTPAQPGVDRTWMASYYPVPDASGAVDGVGIVVREVTDERRATREVEHGRRRLEVLHRLEASIVRADDPSHVVRSALAAVKDLLSAAHAAVYRVDLEARTRTLLALDVPNLTPGVIGRTGPLPEMVADAIVRDRPLVLPDLRELAGADPSFAGAVKVGTLAMLIVPLPGPEGLILMADWTEVRPAADDELAIMREIGDTLAIAFRQAELFNAVAAHAEELEERVEERTRQLSEINAELDAFSYTVSHDLRAPLRAMQGFASAIVEDEGERLSPMGREFAERIVTAGHRMEGLIGDLLEYSRVSRVHFRPEAVDLDSAVATAVRQLEATLGAAGAEVVVETPLGAVTGHRASVTQAVANLLANAAKFVAPGTTPRIRVTAERRGGHVRLTVADNGIGITPDHLDRIFRVFERLHGQESYAGTGIGLAIVRKAVERMSGMVGVESAHGEGSRFWIELPAAIPGEAAPA